MRVRNNEGEREQYGRRVEPDRSWTVYHVFTGIPAYICGNAMVGLSRMVRNQPHDVAQSR